MIKKLQRHLQEQNKSITPVLKMSTKVGRVATKTRNICFHLQLRIRSAGSSKGSFVPLFFRQSPLHQFSSGSESCRLPIITNSKNKHTLFSFRASTHQPCTREIKNSWGIHFSESSLIWGRELFSHPGSRIVSHDNTCSEAFLLFPALNAANWRASL